MKTSEKLKEQCAVFGVSFLKDEAAAITYNGLISLQHRGQEGAGIAVAMGGKILYHKDLGLVSEVFPGKVLDSLGKGKIAIGHTRYSTMGRDTVENVGPFITEYLTGRIATAHNGNITNARRIRQELKRFGINFNATSDSEVVSSLIAYHIIREQDTPRGIIEAGKRLEGAYSLVIASSENKLVALRDPNGYRPLCIGKSDLGTAVASESCALEATGFTFLRDVLPGEMVVIENGKITHEEVVLPDRQEYGGICIFEYVYFARSDSVIDGLSVHEARFNMGSVLAEEHPVDADVICGVPDTGIEAALGYSARSGIPFSLGFVKNRYIGRSFIYPTQSMRDNAVRLKLNPLSVNIEGKRVVLVDDSIVRGTTSERIVRSLKNAGAGEVHVRISSPPFRHACYYGTDIDSEENLVANRMDLDEICRMIGADSIGYISINGLKKACSKCRLPFCTACFTGHGIKHAGRKSDLEED
jgi:amidophosphoribosyltransferase